MHVKKIDKKRYYFSDIMTTRTDSLQSGISQSTLRLLEGSTIHVQYVLMSTHGLHGAYGG